VSAGRSVDDGGPDLALQLQENLVRFVHVLRHLGVPVNPAETVDGLAALELVDLGSRGEVRAALRATLVKTEGHAPLFDKAFDLFFARPEERQARTAERLQARDARRARLEAANAELAFQGEPLELTPEQIETYTRLGEVQQERLRDFLSETSAGYGVDGKLQALVESIVRGYLDRLRREMGVEANRPHARTGDDDLDTVVEGTVDAVVGSEADPMIHRDMKDIAEADLPRATILIRRLARRLATRLSRRYRETHKRSRPNMRRTIRSNIRHGGVLFDLRYRERKITRPKLLLICDVSGSMARYTAFILEFIFGLRAAVSGVEAFVFSEQLERITGLVAPGVAARAQDLAKLVDKSKVWGRGTDLGASLETLFEKHENLLSRDTVAIIVSDTKTLGADQADDLLRKMKPRVKEILWLNTLPREDWPSHRTVGLFARHSDMRECYTLAHLEQVIRVGVGRHMRAT